MKLSEILDELDAVFLSGEEHADSAFTLAGASDLMSDLLAKSADGAVFLTGLATVQSIRTAVVSGVGAVVFVRDKRPPDEVIEMAREEDIPVLTTPYSMFVSCGRLHGKGLAGLDGDR